MPIDNRPMAVIADKSVHQQRFDKIARFRNAMSTQCPHTKSPSGLIPSPVPPRVMPPPPRRQQSFTSNWPKMLWLAVDEHGVHLLDFRSRNVLCTYEYDYIVNYSPAINSLMIITGSTRKQSKIILNTGQVGNIFCPT